MYIFKTIYIYIYLRASRVHVEVQRGDGVRGALQAVPSRRVPSADDHQGAGLRAGYQPIARFAGDLDGHKTQDGAALYFLQGGGERRRVRQEVREEERRDI